MDFSGTKEQLEKRLKLYQRMAEKHLIRHKRKHQVMEHGKKKKKTC